MFRRFQFFVTVAATLLAMACAAVAFAAPVYLNTTEGEQRLMSAKLRQHFFAVQPYVETQQNLAFCGPASIVAIMNSLGSQGVARPAESRLYPYNFYTQDNIFNADTQRIKSYVGVSTSGMTLAEMTRFLDALGLRATSYYGDALDASQLRRLIKDGLKNPSARIVVNYSRKTLAQEGGGHMSPLAAYDEASDSVLLLDVAKFKYPPAWISIEELLAAIQTIDSDGGRSRGIVIAERLPQSVPSPVPTTLPTAAP